MIQGHLIVTKVVCYRRDLGGGHSDKMIRLYPKFN